MEELKRCTFCGGEVFSSVIGVYISFSRVFMESGEYWFDCSEKDKERIKADLIEAWNKRYKEN